MHHTSRLVARLTRAVGILALFALILGSWEPVPAKADAAASLPSTASFEQPDRFDLQGPPGSGMFGQSVYPLPDGSLIVVDPNYSESGIPKVGAVYVYDANHLLIHRLTGSQANDQIGYSGVNILPNGNYVVRSSYWDDGSIADVGAVTWCSATTGCDGVVSPSNSLIGSLASDRIGSMITILSSGNYLIRNDAWPIGTMRGAGAVTWCNAAAGCFGKATPENSLVGTHALDRVGLGVTELANGDYVVRAPYWHNDSNTSVGAVTWCSGTAGCVGSVNAANSLVGSQAGDNVGGKIFGVSSGDFVVVSSSWANSTAKSAGAVTWCPGNGGCTGVVSPANSLVGTMANDQIGSNGVTLLSNGNFVVNSPYWSNGSLTSVGAVTWCQKDGGCIGPIPANQSLMGLNAYEEIGDEFTQGLTNGNYVVTSTLFRPGANRYITATFCSGTTGCSGTLDINKSLYYTYPETNWASYLMTVTPLDDGSYVVGNRSWWNGSARYAGSVTWCNGQTGCVGQVTASNSLVGSQTNDQVGWEIYALAGGKYVVNSLQWSNGANQFAGAVTFCKGPSGCVGVVSAQNSLVGEHNSDTIGSYLIVLNNHNYVVSSGSWDNGSAVNVGHVTWCSGETGCKGTVFNNRSLIGSQADTFVGHEGLVALSNGNYVARDYFWPNGSATQAGSVTWCSGDIGCTGMVSPANSLVGTQTDDHVSNIITPLANGNYVIQNNSWDNGSIAQAGSVALGAGNAPVPVGPVTPDNSILGTRDNQGMILSTAYDSVNGQLVVGIPLENRVAFLSIPSTTIRSGAWNDPATWDYGVPAPNGEAVIASGYTVTVSGSASVGEVTVQNSGTLALANGSNLTVRRRFDNQGSFQGTAGTVIIAGAGEHGLNASGPTVFGNLTIQSGAILVEEPDEDYFSVLSQLDNQGTIRKIHTVSGTGRLSFGLTGAAVELTTIGTINKLSVDRVDQLSPDAKYGSDRYRLNSERYWTVSFTQTDSSPYLVNLWLPHTLAGANAKAGACQLNFIQWDCGRTSSDNAVIRLDGISQLPGIWMVGQEKDTAGIQFGGLSQVYDGHTKPVQVTTQPAGLSIDTIYMDVNGTVYPPNKGAPVNAGSYSVQVTVHDANYIGSASATLTIAKADQAITFGTLPQKTYGDADFLVSASASSGLPVRFSVGVQDACTISSSTLHLTGAGSCTVTAEQDGSQNYNPASPVSHTFTIGKANAVIRLDGLNQVVDGNPRPVTVYTVPADLPFSIIYQSAVYKPSTEPPSLPGRYMITVQITDANYQGEVTGTLTIGEFTLFLPALQNK